MLILETGEPSCEKETSIGCLWDTPQPGTEPTAQACALRESNPQPFGAHDEGPANCMAWPGLALFPLLSSPLLSFCPPSLPSFLIFFMERYVLSFADILEVPLWTFLSLALAPVFSAGRALQGRLPDSDPGPLPSSAGRSAETALLRVALGRTLRAPVRDRLLGNRRGFLLKASM